MRTPLVIFGVGDVGRLARAYFRDDTDYEPVAFTVDRPFLSGDSFAGLPLFPFDELTRRHPPGSAAVFVGIGYTQMNHNRAAKFAEVRALGYRLASYLSSRCTYLSEHPPGENCLILEDNTVQSGVRIGDDVTLWSGNHLGHDSTIGDHVFVTSHVVISGWVRVGDYCFLGVNSTLRNGITVAPRTLVGAGAAITADTVEGGVYVPPRAILLDKRSDAVAL